MRFVCVAIGAFLLGGCASADIPAGVDQPVSAEDFAQSSRYAQDQDAHPEFDTAIQELTDPEPVSEPRSRRGNNAEYTVRGRTYKVMTMVDGYVEEGIASFYGQKFHGYETSNGELFDVYKLSAAHKTLPLPCYVKVTNLENNKTVVVRVNDRGPFHSGRMIDLSYAAAVRLGYDKKGTAKVRIEVLKAPFDASDAKYLQIEAFSNAAAADALRERLTTSLNLPVTISNETRDDKVLHKVRVGPLRAADVPAIQTSLKAANFNPGILLP